VSRVLIKFALVRRRPNFTYVISVPAHAALLEPGQRLRLVSDARALARTRGRHQGRDLQQMEGMGHFPMFEHPEPFKKYLARLLATIMTR
jgi:pimeloyl-ACP methyl ester carboxylesterase